MLKSENPKGEGKLGNEKGGVIENITKQENFKVLHLNLIKMNLIELKLI